MSSKRADSSERYMAKCAIAMSKMAKRWRVALPKPPAAPVVKRSLTHPAIVWVGGVGRAGEGGRRRDKAGDGGRWRTCHRMGGRGGQGGDPLVSDVLPFDDAVEELAVLRAEGELARVLCRGKVWGDVGRCGGDVGEIWGDVGRCVGDVGEMWEMR